MVRRSLTEWELEAPQYPENGSVGRKSQKEADKKPYIYRSMVWRRREAYRIYIRFAGCIRGGGDLWGWKQPVAGCLQARDGSGELSLMFLCHDSVFNAPSR